MHVYVQIHYGKRLDIFGGTDTIHQLLPWCLDKGNLRSLDIIGETDHTDSLPSTWTSVSWLICERGGELTKTDTRSDTSVKTLEAVGLVNVGEGVEHSLLSGSIRVGILDGGLHLLVSPFHYKSDLPRLGPPQ